MAERSLPMPETARKDRLQRSISLRAQTIINAPDFLQYTRDNIAEFRLKISLGRYSPQEQDLINAALDLAVVAYQDNAHSSRRVRKQTVRVGDERFPIPYIQHPLSVAEAMIGEPRLVKMAELETSDGEAVSLRVHQHAYKAEVIAAALLHDAVEDVRLQKPRLGIHVEGREKWSQFLRSYFNGTDSDKVESIVTMITAVTKRDQLREGAKTQILESEVYDAVRRQLPYQGDKAEDEKIDTQVLRTLSDLNTMLQSCFGVGSDLHFDNQSFLNFYGALAIKCHDIENNLEDGGVREDKRIRAQILAIFARIYGLPVASRIAAHLVVDTQHDMFWGFGNEAKNLKEAAQLVQIYARLENQREKPSLTFLRNGREAQLQADAIQIPILSLDEIQNTPAFRPVPQFRFVSADPNFLKDVKAHFYAPEGNYLDITMRRSHYVGVPVCEETQRAILESGRQCYYFNVYRSKNGDIDPNNPQLIAVIRIQDEKPTAHDVLQQGSTVMPVLVPETRLISSVYKGDPATAMNVFSITTSAVEI